MDFLPEEDKKKIRREYHRRFFFVAGLFSFFAILMGVILLLSIVFSFKSQEEGLSRQIKISEERFKFGGTESIIPLVKELNSKISFLDKEYKNIRENSSIIKGILENKPGGVQINSFSIETSKVTLSGSSNTRDNFLLFINNLKKEDFKKVESPINNIIKEKDIEFTINIEL